MNIESHDQKLGVALACPTSGLEILGLVPLIETR
jgi:hypothetical protein